MYIFHVHQNEKEKSIVTSVFCNAMGVLLCWIFLCKTSGSMGSRVVWKRGGAAKMKLFAAIPRQRLSRTHLILS